jgi:hypothetical protein
MLLTTWLAELLRSKTSIDHANKKARRAHGGRRTAQPGILSRTSAVSSLVESVEPRLVLAANPVALAQGNAIRHINNSNHTITVSYIDDVAIQAASIGTGDILVNGPNGYSQVATLQTVSSTVNAARITATYTVTAPGGTWDMTDRGAYAIYAVASEVTDGTNTLPFGQIGSFLVEPTATDRDGYGYRASQVPFEFTSISATGASILPNVDDSFTELTDLALGDFQFPFYGATYKNLFVATNGLVTFGAGDSEFDNGDLSLLSTASIAGLWDDIVTNASGVRWRLTGTGNEQVLTIQWDAARYIDSGATITFQMVLEEAGGAIQFNYLDISATTSTHDEGSSATVGIRDLDTLGNRSLLISLDDGPNDFVASGKSIRIERDFDGRWMPMGPFTASNGQTENLSPNRQVVGAIHTLLAHPTNANILWAGAVNGGVWRTDNARDPNPFWRSLTDSLPSQSIGSLAFDLADPTRETVYVGIGRYSSYAQLGAQRTGLWKTADGGATWQQMSNTLVGKNISAIHASGNTVVVAVNTADAFTYQNIGIWRSTDGGATFTQISTTSGVPGSLPGGVSYDMFADPTNANVLYTSVVFPSGGPGGVYKSIDMGATWALVSNPAMNALFTNGTSNVEIAAGNSQEVYVAIINGGALAGLFRSPDAGVTWVQMDTPSTNENGSDVGLNPSGGKGPGAGSPPESIAGGQGAIHFSIVADPNNANIVYVGGDRQPRSFGDTGSFPNSIGANDFSGRLFRGDASRAAGTQFVHLTHSRFLGAAGGGTLSSSSPHADSREMVFDANGDLIEGDDGGIYRRTLPQSNLGDWFGIAGNMMVTEAHDADWDSSSNIAISGNQDTGTTQQSQPGNSIWNSIHTGDGGDVLVVENAAGSVRYSSFQNLGAFRRTSYDLSGNQTGVTFPTRTLTSGNPLSVAFRTPLAANQNNGAIYIQGTNGIYESLDGGNTIAQIQTSAGSAGNGALDQSAIVAGGSLNGVPDDNILWVGAINRVYLRNAAGGVLNQLTGLPTGGIVRDLVVNSSNWQQAFYIDDNQVVMTSNAGTSWTDITGNLMSTTDALRTISYVVTPLFEAIVVGTHHGVYMTPLTNYGTVGEWIKLGLDMPNVVMIDMEYDATDDVLIAGTMGRGVWMLNEVQDVVMETLLDFDYGDAPASFQITKSQGGGRHVATGVTLGTQRDFEADAVPTLDAGGDDNNNLADDEDGVTFLTPLQSGRAATVRINVSQPAFVSMYVDTNLNGRWDDAGGEVISAFAAAAGDNDIAFNLPSGMTTTTATSWIRVLATTSPSAGNSGAGAIDGEVEDHEVVILPDQIVTVTLNPGTMSENGGSVTGTVTLNIIDPLNASIVTLISGDLTEATVPLTVTIPAGQASANFTVTAVDDTILDGTQSVLISASMFSAFGTSATVNVTDRETLSVSVSNATVAENAGPNARTGVVTRNNTDIAGPFTVTLTSNDLSELTVPVTVLIPGGASSANFSLSAVDDFLVDGTILVNVSVAATGYVGASAPVNVLDDESSSLVISQTGGTTSVNESGTTDTIFVSLSQQPTSDVVLAVSVLMTNEFSVSPTTITIPAASWNVPQPITVTGLDDVFVDGTRNSTVVISVIDGQSDVLFQTAPDANVAVENLDNDTATLIINESGGSTVLTETASTDTVTVRLKDRPLADVVFSVTASDLSEATTTPSVLRFTSANWNIPQTVQLTSIDDTLVDGNILSQLVIAVRPSQSHDAFDLMVDTNVTVTTLDNEVAGFVVTQTNGSTQVSESGTTDTVQVRLSAAPVSNVVFTVTASNPAEAVASPLTLTFTPANWNVAQTVTVTGVDDLLFDKTQTSQLTIAVDAANSQDAFDSLAASVTSVVTLDNEPDPPTVTGPASDVRTPFPTITWTPVPGAVSYEIYIITFRNPNVALINTTVTGTSYTSPIALEIFRHRVWVRANLASGIQTEWSLPRTFDVRTPPVIQPIVRFQETYRPTITWSAPVPNVASYQIQIDSRFTAPFGLVMESGLTTTSYTLKTDLPLGLYRVWVRAFTTEGQVSAWSNPGEFFVAVYPTAVAPPSSTFDTTPTFRWTTVLGGREYRIRVFDTTTRQFLIDQGGLTTPEFTPTVPLRTGIYRWNVQASGDNAVVGLWSVGNELYVGGRTTVRTSGVQGSRTPTIRWDAVEGVFTYSLYMVRTDGTGGVIEVNNLTTNSFRPSSALTPGGYRIWVRAISITGQVAPWSLPVEMTIVDASPEMQNAEPASILTDELTGLTDFAPVFVSVSTERADDRRGPKKTPAVVRNVEQPVEQLSIRIEATVDSPEGLGIVSVSADHAYVVEGTPSIAIPVEASPVKSDEDQDGIDAVLSTWNRLNW